MPVALLFFGVNYAKITLVFPNYAHPFFLNCALQLPLASKSKNIFSLIRSRLFLLADLGNG